MKQIFTALVIISCILGLSACYADPVVPDASTGSTTATEVEKIYEISETENAVLLENDVFRIGLSKTDGTVLEFYHKAIGKNVNDLETPYFTYLVLDNYWLSFPVSLSLNQDKLAVTFDDGTQVEFVIDVYEYGYTIALETQLPKTINRIVFSNLAVSCEYTQDSDSWRLSGLSMNTNTDPWNYPGGEDRAVCAMAFPANGDTAGAKLGVVFSTVSSHQAGLMEIADKIDPAVGLFSTKGGVYSRECQDCYEDMVICEKISPKNAVETAALAAKYGIDCINFHQGAGTFIQGNFNFISALTRTERNSGVKGTAQMFRERIGNIMRAEGVKLGLHTYASLVSSEATEILSDPKWQQQFCFVDSYTLGSDLAAEDTHIVTCEDASRFERQDVAIPYNDVHTAYLLVDSEIILVLSNDETGFTEVLRGQLGTKPQAHLSGAEIRQLGGMFNMFQPEPGSELFYAVAKWTAEAYNDGGFSYIYLDGLESMYDFCDVERYWYYLAEFVHTVVVNCDTEPIVDYSCMMPSIWNTRSREGATDTPFHGYKQFIRSHVSYNELQQRGLMTGTLGWMSFCPDANAKYKNCVAKTLFRDDIDFLGAMAIAYNQCMTYLDFNKTSLDGTTMQADNYAYYSLYSKLRKEGYFSEAVKQKIREGDYEYKLVSTDSGYAFREMQYDALKIYGLGDGKGTANNPFAAQKPYIRIEGRYSSLGENEITVLPLDETVLISALQGEHSLESMDLTGNQAFLIRAFGNGQKDAAVILSIRSEVTVEVGVLDFLVPLDHTGWKEFVLIDADNGDYGSYDLEDYLMPMTQIDYETYRGMVEMEHVNSITVTPIGNCEGAYLDDLRACVVTEGTVQDPSVTVSGQTVCFQTRLCGGEYIEFDPDSGEAVLHYYEGNKACVRQISYIGEIVVPSGDYTFEYSATALTDAPVRARIVIGIAGELLENS